MFTRLVTNKTQWTIFPRSCITCCNTIKKKILFLRVANMLTKREWVTFWWFSFLGSLKQVFLFGGKGGTVKVRGGGAKQVSKNLSLNVCLQRTLKQNNRFWSKCLWGQSLTRLKEWFYGSLVYINQLIKSQFRAPTSQTK